MSTRLTNTCSKLEFLTSNAKKLRIIPQNNNQVLITFPDGLELFTSDVNASRCYFQNQKFNLQTRKGTRLTPIESAQCESWLSKCLAGTALQELENFVKKVSNHQFLIDSTHLTLADIALMNETMTCQNVLIRNWNNFVTTKLKDFGAQISSDLPPSPPSCDKKVENGNQSNENNKTNFIRQIIEENLRTGQHKEVVTRFPPEPNGFLHLGHAKSICLNFGLAKDFNGRCHLRFDDTNPLKEDMRFIDSIQEDVKWLGFDWGDHIYYSSDYFQQLYEMAVDLIKKSLAYVDDQTEEEVRLNRGDLITPGTNSPYRDRSVEENLLLFEKMKIGEVPEGKCILRAKIDMSHGNMHMRDPPIYRVRFHPHPRTGTSWCIYPIYDFAHGQSDSIERITHSICTLEFEDHRSLYEWFQEKLDIYRTRQIEFARLNCTHTVMSKRKLMDLVQEKFVEDWDDPRLPTISAMRRRGYTATAIKDFCDRIGVAKRDTLIPIDYLESCVRNSLHAEAQRRHVVLRPVKVIITDYKGEEELECANHPEDMSLGSRRVYLWSKCVREDDFQYEIYIDESDFMVDPPANFFRLSPGKEVRLRWAYWIKCTNYELGEDGKVSTIYCTHDSTTKGGSPPSDGRKVKGTLHWVSAANSMNVEVRLYEHLFTTPTPDSVPEGKSWRDFINPKSLQLFRAKAERCLSSAKHPTKGGVPYQFERVGFFVADYNSTNDSPLFNLTVSLTDSWAAKSDYTSKEAQAKDAAKAARDKAAAERQRKKEEKERRLAEKKAAPGKQYL